MIRIDRSVLINQWEVTLINLNRYSLDSETLIFTEKSNMSDQPKPDLGLLEEDDEFEEFPAEGKLYSIQDLYQKPFYLKLFLPRALSSSCNDII